MRRKNLFFREAIVTSEWNPKRLEIDDQNHSSLSRKCKIFQKVTQPLKPVVIKSSFGAIKINNNVAYTDDEIGDHNDDEETASTSSSRSSTPYPNQKSKGKKRKVDELQEYLTERNQECFKKMNVMQEKTRAILEKVDEKL